MSAVPASLTSQRLLALLSLLQSHREWGAAALATKLQVSERTVRRDVDRLRELGYTIASMRGPDGGYQLGAGEQLPPLLFDEEQAIAIAVALRTASTVGAGIEEGAERALRTISQILPERLARRIALLEVAAATTSEAARVEVNSEMLLRIGEAIQRQEEIRFRYQRASLPKTTEERGPRRIEPHHLLLSSGRWYLIGWSAEADEWRILRADRMRLMTHNGRRFTRRTVPGASPSEFLAARFKGSHEGNRWPCVGTVVIDLPAAQLAPFAGDGLLEDLGDGRSRFEVGSWSWNSLATLVARFGAELAVVDPPELRTAFADLAQRSNRAAETNG